MGDPGFESGAESDAERLVDDQLRREFSRTFLASEGAPDVLQGLGPAFRRARRTHQVKQGALAVAASVLVLGAVGVLSRSLIADEARVTVAGEVDGADGQDELVVTGTTAVPAPQTDDDNAEGVSEESSATSVTSSATSAADESEDPDSSTTAPTTTTSSERTDDTSNTAVADDGSVTVFSDCGSIVVMPSGSSVQLIDAIADSGYSSDVKSSGPEKVEVGFEDGSDGHCEIEVRMSDGQLQVEREE